MIAYGARKLTQASLEKMGFSEGTAKAWGWVVWAATIAATVDVASIVVEGATTAGTELAATGIDAVTTGAEAIGMATETVATVGDISAGVIEAAAIGIEILVPVSIVVSEISAEYKSLIAQGQKSNVSLRILLVAADPYVEARLHLDREFREIRQSIQRAKFRDKFIFDSYLAARPEDLVAAMLNFAPDIVHFSGHGGDTGCLCFENQSGEVVMIRPEAIARVFAQLSKKVRCVILNACYSAKQADAILQHVDYVIGMREEIGDKAAIASSSGFYQGLGAGMDIEKSFEIGLSTIQFGRGSEHLIPVLLKKHNQ